MALPPWLTTALLGNAPQPPQDQALANYNNPNLTMRQRVGLDPVPGQALSGPQQSYNPASKIVGLGGGNSGQAGQEASTYNNSPYTPKQGTIANTGAPQANSQAELVGGGERGWNIYPSTPTWTGSPNSESPPARQEGDFGRPLVGPTRPQINPIHMQNIAALLARYRALRPA